ncbi:MAG TPA: RidA family protein [Geminicoccus sp.]|jgi:enamine deaminase RidA (YjgF/YER057c/UK114 family)|uniref:RidA family protein n=1 Tax=Geminicoccus sp. TaxID=2024832 RepID=UPI002E31A0F3|nr:RidA family protein [Geminicoccus sp.]HEX2527136.1 RidA family protein [Geminicoccus sp.]
MRKPIKGEGGVFPPYGRYHHGIVVTGAERLLFLSGQLAVSPDGTVPVGVLAQTELIFGNIDLLLAEAGMRRSNIVRLTTYLLDPAHRVAYMGVRDHWVEAPAPASTLLFINALAHPDALIEIEAIAAS